MGVGSEESEGSRLFFADLHLPNVHSVGDMTTAEVHCAECDTDSTTSTPTTTSTPYPPNSAPHAPTASLLTAEDRSCMSGSTRRTFDGGAPT